MAAYLLAKELLNEPVADRQAFYDAASTVTETRNHLPYGRSNIKDDLRATKNISLFRGRITRKISESNEMRDLLPKPTRPIDRSAALAAAAVTAGAGFCDEHAATAMFLHAPKLRDGDTLKITSTDEGTHTVTRLTLHDAPSALLLDGWKSGPVVKQRDSSSTPDRSSAEASISYGNAKQASQKFKSLLGGAQSLFGPEWIENEVKKSEPPYKNAKLDSQSTVSHSFANRARIAIERDAAEAKTRATEIARDEMGLPEKEAKEFSKIIVRTAMWLDKPTRRI
ncbi:hypothetical protein KDW41_30405 [Burkholderia vietnamiensis]|nr:hypothetical protein [Burkholderia vietnamiensis]